MNVPQTEVILRHEGAELARVVLPPGEYIIGRNPDVAIRADTPLISRQHARLLIAEDHVQIEDLRSINGTFVGDQPVAGPTRIQPDQPLRVGNVTVEIRQLVPVAAPAPSALQRLLPAELLAEKRYALGHVIAQGGMGAILDAQQAAMKRQVAMKIMLAEDAAPDAVARFIEEAQVTGQLEHPNIVPVHELGVDDRGQPFYTMKMVRGITLGKVLKLLAEGVPATVAKYPLPVLLTIFQKVCDALAFAHSRGVIHRDLKPDNIMLDDFGVVLVMDWGLAKLIGGTRSPASPAGGEMRSIVASARAAEPEFSGTLEGTIMGTPQYMAPEQARGEIEALDARADVYALGGILYTILALRPPVTGRRIAEVLDKVQRGEVEPLVAAVYDRRTSRSAAVKKPATSAREVGDGHRPPLQHLPGGRIPDSLAAVVAKAMAFDREHRYPSVAALQHDLEAYQNGFATGAEKAGLGRQVVLALKRHKVIATSAAILLLVVTGFMVRVVASERNGARLLARLRGTAPTFYEKARSHLDNGKTKEALERIAFAVDLSPANADYIRLQADALQTDQQFAAAAAAYRRLLSIFPGDDAAKENLALCEKLAREHPDGTGLTPLNYEELFRLARQQERPEAHVFGNLAGKGKEMHEALIRARLKPLMENSLWKDSRLTRNSLGGWQLDLNGFPLVNLEILRGLPLEMIRTNNSGVTDISPLTGMPLKKVELNVEKQLRDLSPLRGAPIEELAIGFTGVEDLSPLAGMPLRSLTIYWTRVSDLSPLRGTPLRLLEMRAVPSVKSLEPIRGLLLKELIISNCAGLSDLSPLRGMPLEKFGGEGLQIISDFTPVISSRLRQILLAGSGFRDATLLASCRELNALSIPPNCTGIKTLRQLPNLRFISTVVSTNERPILSYPAEAFWKEYDTQQAAGKK